MKAGDNVNHTLLIAGIPALIAIGGSLMTLEATAQETEKVSERVRAIEVKQAEGTALEVMVAQNTKDLAALTAIVTKMADSQTEMLKNQVSICVSTGADCTR